MEIVILILVLGFMLGTIVWLIAQTSYQAYRRGYQPIVWALAAIIAMNPIYLFVVLVLVPNRRRLRLREQFAAELDRKLADRKGQPPVQRSDFFSTETQTAVPKDAKANLDATRTYGGDEKE